MPQKKHIVNCIAAVAKQLGRAPSLSEFAARTGISTHSVFRMFPKWNDAVRAAGLRTYTLNVGIEDGALLEDWGRTARRNKSILRKRFRLPRHIYGRAGKYDPHTLAERFGGWSSVPRAFCNFARGKKEWADVLALLPAPVGHGRARPTCSAPEPGSAAAMNPRTLQHAPLKGRPTYGDALDFATLRHEPVNELGVVLLFGMLAKDLGYVVESMQAGFPDCEAKRQIGAKRWQRVSIEFEFESKNYRDHGHPLTGCDVIVCWHHNWPDCPAHLEVLELSSRIKSLASSSNC